jgi:hypothetical protein
MLFFRHAERPLILERKKRGTEIINLIKMIGTGATGALQKMAQAVIGTQVRAVPLPCQKI